ncbi:hypothetical protein HHK36_028962 [Tetracentron sinense]|uniref:Uncharacterized protein n=1 Tax=Tetracentron sinense TaxID=13715 RepID=A0A834YH64_TETSI|nr:hypothetical protein HHK36_028962 [Tetracentron sinense]
MEEAKAVQSTTTQIPKPPSTAPNLPPQAPPPQNKKRKLDNVDFHNSNYYKICTVIKELRPYFIEPGGQFPEPHRPKASNQGVLRTVAEQRPEKVSWADAVRAASAKAVSVGSLLDPVVDQ